jgi:hypothetical protein
VSDCCGTSLHRVLILVSREPVSSSDLPPPKMWFSNITIPNLSQISPLLAPLLSYTLSLFPFSSPVIPECRTMPGDPSWPSTDLWNTLNHSVDGRLIKTIPIASVCHHGPYYNEAECQHVQKNWRRPEFQCVRLSSSC